MARNIGTVTDEERLVPLLAGDDGYVVDVTHPVRTTEVPAEGAYAWRLREESDVPRLAFAPVADDDEAGALPTRELSADGDALLLPVPERLLADGLGLDLDAYDDDEPLLFEPAELDDEMAVGMTREDAPAGTADVAVELVPLRFGDGTPYPEREHPTAEGSPDSDPVAEAAVARGGGDGTPSRSGTVSAPVDAPVLDEVLSAVDADRENVVAALETVARRGLVGVEHDASPHAPLTVDGRALVAVDDGTWRDEVVPRLDVDEAAAEAAREVHARQIDALVPADSDERERFGGRTPVVVEPPHDHEAGSDPAWDPE